MADLASGPSAPSGRCNSGPHPSVGARRPAEDMIRHIPGGTMDRREFLKTGGALAAWSGLARYAEPFAEANLRVGLIGTGWYGKADLFRLIQVAPVEVVSLCDVDRDML